MDEHKHLFYNGDTDAVIRLLEDPNFDPSANDNNAILLAATHGHLAIVAALLKDPRVDPSARDSVAMSNAAHYGHIDVLDLLLKDSRVDSSDCAYVLQSSARNGNLKAVICLLEGHLYLPSTYNNTLKIASKYKHHQIVEFLLCDTRVLPSLRRSDFCEFIKNFSNFASSYKIVEVYEDIYAKLRKHVCTILFSMQELELPTPLSLMILDELYEIAPFIPMYVKWNMTVKIKHFKPICV